MCTHSPQDRYVRNLHSNQPQQRPPQIHGTCSRSLLCPAPGRCHPVPADPQNQTPACTPPTTHASTGRRMRASHPEGVTAHAQPAACWQLHRACGTLRLPRLTQCLLTISQKQTQPAHRRQDSTRAYTRMTSYLEERVSQCTYD
jgi:hypothetical protein